MVALILAATQATTSSAPARNDDLRGGAGDDLFVRESDFTPGEIVFVRDFEQAGRSSTAPAQRAGHNGGHLHYDGGPDKSGLGIGLLLLGDPHIRISAGADDPTGADLLVA